MAYFVVSDGADEDHLQLVPFPSVAIAAWHHFEHLNLSVHVFDGDPLSRRLNAFSSAVNGQPLLFLKGISPLA